MTKPALLAEMLVLPASAGMIHVQDIDAKNHQGAPRIRGDDPMIRAWILAAGMCSPHPRG